MMPLARTLFKISKTLHKYVGLVGLVYFVLMGVTGILLNHPDLLRSFSLPMGWMPSSYQYREWNRMALRETVFHPSDPDTLFVSGKNGVWQSRDGGRSFSPMDRGFPISAYDRETRCLLMDTSGTPPRLYAGSRSGLYRYDFKEKHWQHITAGLPVRSAIVDLAHTGDELLVFTPKAAYRLAGPVEAPSLHQVPLSSIGGTDQRSPLFRLLLKLHDGSLLGLPGRLLMDIMSLALVFLSLSAIYIWYIPWRIRRFKRKRARARHFRFFHKYHLKLGIYAALFLLVFALTGIFVRPPLILAITGYSVPAALLGDTGIKGEWPSKITRAVYLSDEKRLLIAARDGFFAGPADGSRPFIPYRIGAPVHGMGVNVLEPLSEQRLLIGSFSGIYVWDIKAQTATDVHGQPLRQMRRGKLSASMASGAVIRNGTLHYWADYRRGLQTISETDPVPVMPDRMADESTISLWHFLFELHNGRIFRDWFGKYVWLIVPVGGLLLLINTATGCYDWFYRKLRAR